MNRSIRSKMRNKIDAGEPIQRPVKCREHKNQQADII